ncbi:MAG: zf-HC2 domain-containing protein [Candidatus Aquicultorales bacterium]
MEHDPTAIRAIVDAYKTDVRFIIARLVGEHAADACFQAALRDALDALPDEGGAGVRHWLYARIVDYCLEILDSRTVNHPKAEDPSVYGDCSGMILKGRLLRYFITAQLATLDPEQRAVLVLSGVPDLTREDIARMRQIGLPDVDDLISRGRQELARLLRGRLNDDGNDGYGRFHRSKWCSGFEPLIERFIDGKLDMREKLKLLSHFKKCRRCRLVLSDLSDVVTALKVTREYPPPVELVDRFMDGLANPVGSATP